MKQMIFLFFFAFTFKAGYCQQLHPDTSKNNVSGTFAEKPNTIPAHDYDYYKNKSTTQKTVAWVLTGGGIVLTVAGMVTYAASATEDILYSVTLNETPKSTTDKETTGATLVITGVAMIAGSIPLFISSHRNKLKARIAPGSQQLSTYLPMTSNKQVHGLTLTIPLGK